MTAVPRVQVQQVTKRFVMGERHLEVLREVTFDVDAAQSLAIVGVSGAGKSTLLHIIGGLDHPTAGDVLIEGQSMLTGNEKQLARYRNEHIGFVFQFHYLLEEFNAIENVMMPLAISGMSRTKAAVFAEESLDRVGLSERKTHRPAELSGGEQQRVAIARALVHKPSIVLMDEPTGNLDTETSREVHELIRDTTRDLGATAIVVTHDPHLGKLLDRTIQIVDGSFVEQATAA